LALRRHNLGAFNNRETRAMPELFKLLLRNAAIGFGVAVAFVAALLLSDTGGVGTLVMTSDMGVVAVFLLTFFTGLTFASAQMGFAVMSGDWKNDQGPHGGHRVVRLRLSAPKAEYRRVKVRV
jgi:hypothetical protein